MDINKLAVFIGEVGYNEAESLTGLDADLLQKAVAGESLSTYETALIDNAYSGMILAESDYIDFDSIDKTASALNDALLFMDNAELADSFRESLSFGQVDFESLENNYGLFANLTQNQTEMLVDWLSDNADADAKEFLDAYALDDYDFWDIEDSAFWEWFRDTFYSD